MRAAGLVLLIMSIGCARPDAADRWTGRADTLPNGVVHVRNPGTGVWDSSSAWRVGESLRIGDERGGAATFGANILLAVDQANRIHVLDRNALEIRVFAEDGEPVRTFGRRGQGPGELTAPNGIVFDDSGRLWVSDPHGSGFMVFDSAGQYVKSYRRPFFGNRWVWEGGFDGTGQLYEEVAWSTPAGTRFGLAIYDSTFQHIDTVAHPPPKPSPAPFEFSGAGGTRYAAVPFAPVTLVRRDPRGWLWTGWSDEYQLIRTTVAGDTLGTVAVDRERVAVAEDDRAQAVARLRRSAGPGGTVDESRIPRVYPAFEDFQVDSELHSWVRLPSSSDDPGTRYDVLDPEGRLLGTVDLPISVKRDVKPLIFREAIYAVAVHESGALHVVRLSLDRRSGIH